MLNVGDKFESLNHHADSRMTSTGSKGPHIIDLQPVLQLPPTLGATKDIEAPLTLDQVPTRLTESLKQSFNMDHPDKQTIVQLERRLRVMLKKFDVVVSENEYLRTQLRSSEEIRKNQTELIKLLQAERQQASSPSPQVPVVVEPKTRTMEYWQMAEPAVKRPKSACAKAMTAPLKRPKT